MSSRPKKTAISFSVGNLSKLRPGKKTRLATRAGRAEAWSQSLLPNGTAASKLPAIGNRKPLVLVALAVLVIFTSLTYQLTKLQVVNGERYQGLADGNRLRSKITYAPRGRILDRHGVVLAENVPSFQLVARPYLLPKEESGRIALYGQIGRYSQTSPEEIKRLTEARGLDYTQALLIKEALTYEQALKLEQKLADTGGFSLDAVPIRQYKSDAAMSHILGYVGRVSEEELKRGSNLLAVDFIGKEGVEQSYDNLLRGQNGVIETEVDSGGRPVRVLSERPTRPGQDIRLTIDYELQQQLAASIAEQSQKAGVKRAAGVVLDPKTEDILASVSLPSYDNNLFSRGIAEKTYQQLLNDSGAPLQNRVISANYPSGSIIKPMHLTGALQEGVVNQNTTIVDRGKIVVPSVYDSSVSYTFNGWNLSGLGPMNARRAIAMSSDIYFYTVGGGYQGFKGLGVEKLAEYYRRYGLGRLTDVDLPAESAGRVPTPDWKKQATGEDWFIGDTYNISIGQGDILVSPLQMASATSSLLRNGQLLQPHVFSQTVDGNTKFGTKPRGEVGVKPEYFQIVREGMQQVIGGTTSASTFAQVPVKVAGKSGTAETDPTTKRKSHAWYTAYAPVDNPRLVFCVLLEEGEGGSQFAAPAIAKTMQWYFKTYPTP